MDSSRRSPEQPVDLTERIKRINDYPTDAGGYGHIWRCILQDGEGQIMVRPPHLRPPSSQIFLGCSQIYHVSRRTGT